jgi:hypothetical protein
MTDATHERLFADYLLTYSNELKAKMKRLNDLIGAKHWLSVGHYKESLIRSVLAPKLPRKFEVGTGFVADPRKGERVLSRQIDLLIWNSADFSPLFRDGEFVIVPPEALAAAIEVKSTLDAGKLNEALLNLDSLLQFCDSFASEQAVYKSIFAYESSLAFPKGSLDVLYEYFNSKSTVPIDSRNKGYLQHLSRSWISSIAILNEGFLNWEIEHSSGGAVVYAAYPNPANQSGLDAYGLFEGTLLTSLILGLPKHGFFQFIPSIVKTYFDNSPESPSVVRRMFDPAR